MLTIESNKKNQEYSFHDIMTLAEEAEKLGKKAMQLGLIYSLTVYVFPDCWQFSFYNLQESELLTPQEAYLRFQKLIRSASNLKDNG
ncbi:MAG: hypothetical protein AAGA80_16245 [Cyanobacteria bacterium P01_F01_bin.143]